MRLEFITPTTIEEMQGKLKEIQFIAKYAPWVQNVESEVMTELGALSIIYVNSVLFGLLLVYKDKHSATIGAVFRQDLRQQNKKAYRLCSRAVIDTVLRFLFTEKKCRKVICKPRKDSRAGKMFAIQQGFKLINTEKDCYVYKLNYEKWALLNGA